MSLNRNIFSVYQVTSYIKSILEEDVLLDGIFIEGEVSNFRPHSSGHLYFTLKDEKSSINCVMFKSYATAAFVPENGMRIVLFGRISLYEKTGQYQVYATKMEPWGKGSLQIAFEQLKEKLSQEGLFATEYKKPIPEFSGRIAVITSPTGAVLQDIINITKRRNKSVELVVVPTLVQGEQAAKAIAQAVKDVNKWKGCDVIILARGGGSLEDLWSFNTEIVARAIFGSKIPVISAIGHETDYTIADFVADLRAPTPSAAAELAVVDSRELYFMLETCRYNLDQTINFKFSNYRRRLDFLAKRCRPKRLLDEVYSRQMHVELLTKKMIREMEHRLQTSKSKLEHKATVIQSLSPFAVLKRGFVIVYNSNGDIKKTAEEIKIGDMLRLSFQDKDLCATVTSEVEKNEEDGIFQRD